MEETGIAKEKKQFKILGFTVWRLMAYFIIYSFAGFIIETCYGVLTKGVLESRQSFLYGPFCSIYGIGAVIMIVFLQYFKKNKYTLFFGGFLIGSITEYLISLIGELIFNVIWWDYSNKPFNIGGRICVTFSLFWGVLAIYLISYFHPKVDALIDKIKGKKTLRSLRILTIICIIVILADFIITGFAIMMFYSRLVSRYDLKLKNNQEYGFMINLYENNEFIKNITDKFFNDKKMLKTFPNLKLTAEDGSIIYVDSLLPEITPYYVKFFTPKNN